MGGWRGTLCYSLNLLGSKLQNLSYKGSRQRLTNNELGVYSYLTEHEHYKETVEF